MPGLGRGAGIPGGESRGLGLCEAYPFLFVGQLSSDIHVCKIWIFFFNVSVLLKVRQTCFRSAKYCRNSVFFLLVQMCQVLCKFKYFSLIRPSYAISARWGREGVCLPSSEEPGDGFGSDFDPAEMLQGRHHFNEAAAHN